MLDVLNSPVDGKWSVARENACVFVIEWFFYFDCLLFRWNSMFQRLNSRLNHKYTPRNHRISTFSLSLSLSLVVYHPRILVWLKCSKCFPFFFIIRHLSPSLPQYAHFELYAFRKCDAETSFSTPFKNSCESPSIYIWMLFLLLLS